MVGGGPTCLQCAIDLDAELEDVDAVREGVLAWMREGEPSPSAEDPPPGVGSPFSEDAGLRLRHVRPCQCFQHRDAS